MATWCLPRDLTNKFLDALRSGEIDPEKLAAMSSAERRAEFAKMLGDENAAQVNASFESKLILRDQQRGLVTWAKKLGGLTEPARRDIIAQINKLDRVLDPAEGQSFLEDLAAKKLGVTVTSQEAKEVFDLAQAAEKLRAQIVAEGQGDYTKGWTVENGTLYGRAQQALIEKINSLKPPPDVVKRLALGLYNLPREIQTSILHFSAPFVQLWGMISTPQWYRGFGKMFQYFASEQNYNDLYAYILGHPDYEFARSGKLGLTNLGDKFTKAEEGLQAHLLSDMMQHFSDRTGIPNLVRASQRAFVGTINYVRFARFTDLLNAARLHDADISVGSQTVKDLASVVNVFSGRGPIKEDWAGALNALFYAPRKMTATMNMFNPVYFARLSPVARTAAIRQLTGSLLVTGAVLTLAKVAGAQVSFDPRSTDFAKVNIGGEKLDMTGGNAIYLRLLARLATNHEITSSGQDRSAADTRAQTAIRFFRGKLAPVAGIIANALYGRDGAGQPFSMSNTLYESMTPIAIHSMLDFWLNNPGDTAAYLPALTSFFGVSLESPLPPVAQHGYDVWGDPVPPFGSPRNWRNDPVNAEAERLGVRLDFPEKKIRGIPLTDAQSEQYVHLSGVLAHQRLSELIGSGDYRAENAEQQKRSFTGTRSAARKETQQDYFGDVIDRGEEAKEARGDAEVVR